MLDQPTSRAGRGTRVLASPCEIRLGLATALFWNILGQFKRHFVEYLSSYWSDLDEQGPILKLRTCFIGLVNQRVPASPNKGVLGSFQLYQLDIGLSPASTSWFCLWDYFSRTRPISGQWELMEIILSEISISFQSDFWSSPDRLTDRREAMHMSPPCKSHRLAQKYELSIMKSCQLQFSRKILQQTWHKLSVQIGRCPCTSAISSPPLKGTSRGLEALQSHVNDSYYKSVLCWQ